MALLTHKIGSRDDGKWTDLLTDDGGDFDSEFGGPEAKAQLERKLLWKLDSRMSILVVIYILNIIDRNNVSAARLRGFESDLHLKGQEFNTVLSILHVGYILMQVPSNIFLNYIGKPSIYLPCCVIVWGVISILTGITNNFGGALVTRFFIGFSEAPFIPGALFLVSKWYKRDELGLRTALLLCGFLLSNAFGTLMASGILNGMNGKLGFAAWRWMFIIEGSLTVFAAIIAIFVLPDFPGTSTSWLSPLESHLAIKRMEEDSADIGDQAEMDQGHVAGFVSAMTDWKIWWLAVALTGIVVSLSYNVFFPTLSATMGYNRTVTLLLCAPPWILATFITFALTRHSDKTGERFWHIVIPIALSIVGFVIASCTMNTAARYLSLFLMTLSFSGYIIFFAWVTSMVPRSPSKRAVSLAFINAFAQLGSVAGSYVWPTQWGKTYKNSFAICISTSAFAIILCYILRQHLASLNRKAETVGLDGRARRYRYVL